jgi:hypothetical protein
MLPSARGSGSPPRLLFPPRLPEFALRDVLLPIWPPNGADAKMVGDPKDGRNRKASHS